MKINPFKPFPTQRNQMGTTWDWLTHVGKTDWQSIGNFRSPHSSDPPSWTRQRHDRHGGNGNTRILFGSGWRSGWKFQKAKTIAGACFKKNTKILRFTIKLSCCRQLLSNFFGRQFLFPAFVSAGTVESPILWCFCNTVSTVIWSFRAKHQGHGQLKIEAAKKTSNVDFFMFETWVKQLAATPIQNSHLSISQFPWTLAPCLDETCNLNSTCRDLGQRVFSSFVGNRAVTSCMDSSHFSQWLQRYMMPSVNW